MTKFEEEGGGFADPVSLNRSYQRKQRTVVCGELGCGEAGASDE